MILVTTPLPLLALTWSFLATAAYVWGRHRGHAACMRAQGALERV